MEEIVCLQIGDEVRLQYPKAKDPLRRGVVAGLYEKFFNVHFGNYQESFLWVDLKNGWVRVTRTSRMPVSREEYRVDGRSVC